MNMLAWVSDSNLVDVLVLVLIVFVVVAVVRKL